MFFVQRLLLEINAKLQDVSGNLRNTRGLVRVATPCGRNIPYTFLNFALIKKNRKIKERYQVRHPGDLLA